MFYALCFMLIAGFQKLTLIDYPGKLAATVFTVGCSFRCPFCHNPELVARGVLSIEHNALEKDFFAHLKARKEKLEGVCITGGEPTIQPDLADFIKRIKKLGYAVKLDTNGSRPDVLKKLFQEKLLDFVAMDIKNSPKKYRKTTGIIGNTHARSMLERIKLSINLIRNSGVPYEFRTTVVPTFHTEKDFEKISKWLSGSKSYCLQAYRDAKILDSKLRKKIKGKKIDLEKIKNKIEKNFGEVKIRE